MIVLAKALKQIIFPYVRRERILTNTIDENPNSKENIIAVAVLM